MSVNSTLYGEILIDTQKINGPVYESRDARVRALRVGLGFWFYVLGAMVSNLGVRA